MSPPDSLADLLGATVRVGTVRVGEVAGVYVDGAATRAIGLEVSCAGGVRRFVPWVTARVEGRIVDVESPLVIVDDGASYERLGARAIRDAPSLLSLRALPSGELVAGQVSVGSVSGIDRR